jgi:hypothetical protein
MNMPNLDRKNNNGSVAERVALSILYCTAREGLSQEATTALLNMISGATPLKHEFLNPDSFLVYFIGSDKGISQAQQLAKMINAYAKQHVIPSFGVATHVGDCIATFGSEGQLLARPIGIIISHVMQTAIRQARCENDDLTDTDNRYE